MLTATSHRVGSDPADRSTGSNVYIEWMGRMEVESRCGDSREEHVGSGNTFANGITCRWQPRRRTWCWDRDAGRASRRTIDRGAGKLGTSLVGNVTACGRTTEVDQWWARTRFGFDLRDSYPPRERVSEILDAFAWRLIRVKSQCEWIYGATVEQQERVSFYFIIWKNCAIASLWLFLNRCAQFDHIGSRRCWNLL